jgi:gas vesicle protein
LGTQFTAPLAPSLAWNNQRVLLLKKRSQHIKNLITTYQEELTMSESGFDRDSFFKGLLIGGTLGALAALLFAPKSGKELRGDIVRKGEEAVEGSKRIYNDARTRASAIITEAVDKAQALREEATEQLASARQKAEELLTNAGHKAEELGEGAKSFLYDTKEEVAKKKVKAEKAVAAGVEAARQEFGKK